MTWDRSMVATEVAQLGSKIEELGQMRSVDLRVSS